MVERGNQNKLSSIHIPPSAMSLICAGARVCVERNVGVVFTARRGAQCFGARPSVAECKDMNECLARCVCCSRFMPLQSACC